MGTSRLTATQVKRLDALLRANRAAVLEQQNALGETMGEIIESRVDQDSDDEHDPEGPTMTSEWSRVAGMQEDAVAELRAIDAALVRIDAGTYGRCTSCGGSIGVARLTARPATELCIDCARRAE